MCHMCTFGRSPHLSTMGSRLCRYGYSPCVVNVMVSLHFVSSGGFAVMWLYSVQYLPPRISALVYGTVHNGDFFFGIYSSSLKNTNIININNNYCNRSELTT